MCGVYVGLRLPRSASAIWVASRPRVLPVGVDEQPVALAVGGCGDVGLHGTHKPRGRRGSQAMIDTAPSNGMRRPLRAPLTLSPWSCQFRCDGSRIAVPTPCSGSTDPWPSPPFTASNACWWTPTGSCSSATPTGRREWDFPGGGLKRNEAPPTAARREIREELGVDIDDWLAIGDVLARFQRTKSTMYCFRAELHDPQITLDRGELLAARWFALDELPPEPRGPRRLRSWSTPAFVARAELSRARGRRATPASSRSSKSRQPRGCSSVELAGAAADRGPARPRAGGRTARFRPRSAPRAGRGGCRIAPAAHEPAVLEHVQVVGQGRAGDAQLLGHRCLRAPVARPHQHQDLPGRR